MLIDGKAIAQDIADELRKRPTPKKKLVGLVGGDDLALVRFLEMKQVFAQELGVRFDLITLDAHATTATVVALISGFANDMDVGGIAIELALPAALDQFSILDAVPIDKDIECLASANLGLFFEGRSAILPPAVGTTATILRTLSIDSLATKSVVVLGAGFLIGQPVAHWFRQRARKVTVLRSVSTDEDRESALREADIVVTGVGKKGLVTGVMIKPGAIVIDFGFPADVDAKSIDAAGGIVTPTPRGTGPILIAELFRNFYFLSK